MADQPQARLRMPIILDILADITIIIINTKDST